MVEVVQDDYRITGLRLGGNIRGGVPDVFTYWLVSSTYTYSRMLPPRSQVAFAARTARTDTKP